MKKFPAIKSVFLLMSGALIVLTMAVIFIQPVRNYAAWAWRRAAGGATVKQRLEQYGPAARKRLRQAFENADVSYPPAELVLIGIKDRKVLELWVPDAHGAWVAVHQYPILAASGQAGPKLREGDRQVPEGFYAIESLHPNSRFHLALRVNYPNQFDRQRAAEDGRTNLGGDIMIHGSNASVGCLAMGDPAAEDLFVLVADVRIQNTQLILTPTDFADDGDDVVIFNQSQLPPWTAELYAQLRTKLRAIRGGG